jgi:hypothetical protein
MAANSARAASRSSTISWAITSGGGRLSMSSSEEKVSPEQPILEARDGRCDLLATRKRQNQKSVASESNLIPLFAGAS